MGAKTIQWGKNSISANDARTPGFPQAQEISWVPILHHKQKLTQNGSTT